MNENIFMSLMDYFSVAQFQSTALEEKKMCVYVLYGFLIL